MVSFIERAGIPYAMVGMLHALPNTPLFERLAQSDRLRALPEERGDQFGLTNVVTHLDPRTLLHGYRRVLERLYEPESYFERCRENLARWTRSSATGRSYTRGELMAAARSLVLQGGSAEYKRAYRRFLAWVLRHHPRKIGRALAQAVVGHHYITYTRETVIPGLEAELGRLESLSAAPSGEPIAPVTEGAV
jgi:hypothetical protein